MFFQHALGLFAIIAARYFTFAGGAYLFWWVRGRERSQRRKIQAGRPGPRIRWMEIRYSLLSSALFALFGAIVYMAWERGHTRLYSNVAQYGWVYWASTLPVLLFLHDAYFYFTHRLMHLPVLFRHLHRVHHLSRTPTPWTAFSFHPGEAIIEALIFPLLVFLVPIHLPLFFVFLMLSTVLSVVNHLGYELYPRGFATHPVGRWIISATHHDQHHRDVRSNYGLYFTFWDRWLGSESETYVQTYAAVHEQP